MLEAGRFIGAVAVHAGENQYTGHAYSAKACFMTVGEITTTVKGASPGLVVMGYNSFSKGHGFESQHHIQNGHFSN